MNAVSSGQPRRQGAGSAPLGSAPRGSARLGLVLGGLWLLAVVLALVGLGNLPLRDWDESLVARVALEASNRPWPDRLFPVFWGDPYLNKPPGLHLLIAGAILLWRAVSDAGPQSLPPEGLLRLVPALLSTTVVPLVGLVQTRLRPDRPDAALASAAMALNLLPLARHGRLVMLDGSQLAALLLLWWAALTPDPRRGPLLRQGVVMGLATSALLLLKAPLALPVLAGTLLLRAWDRELGRGRWGWLLGGLALGLLPGLAWHGAHGLVRGNGALEMWLGQGFARVHQHLEGHGGGPLMPLMEVLEGGWPWLALWPAAMGLAWRERHTRAGRWCLGTTGLMALLVLPLRTQLPWYSLLLWPPLLLACGPVLAWLVERAPTHQPPWPGLIRRVPAFWALLGALLVGFAPIAARGGPALQPLAPVAACGGAGLLVGGVLLLAERRRRRRLGAALLIAGLWGALLALFSGPLWLWELNETWPVRSIGEEVRRLPMGAVQLWREGERPSLNWYAGQRLRPWDEKDDAGDTAHSGTIVLLGLEPEAPRLPGHRCVPLPPAGLPPGAGLGPETRVPRLFRCMADQAAEVKSLGASGHPPRPDGGGGARPGQNPKN